MPSTYTSSGIELIADGEQSGLWGQTTNTNLEIINRMIAEAGSISLSGTTHTLTISDGILSDGQYAALVFGGSPSGTNTVTINPNDAKRIFFVINSSGQSVVLTQGSGGNVTILNGDSKIVYTDGAGASAKVTDITDNFAMGSVNIDGGTIDGVTLGTNSAVTEAQIDNININGNAITSTDTNGNIALTPNGTGEVDISKVDIDGGTIDGTVIGGSTPAAISGTTGTFSGNLTVDTDTLFVDAANNEVGIGTTSPGATLEVAGGASNGLVRLGQLQFKNSSGSYSGGTDGVFIFPFTDSLLYHDNYDGGFIWRAVGVESMRIDSSGNVGIGRSPNYKLDAYLSGTGSPAIASSNDNIVTVVQSVGSTQGNVGTLTSHPLVLLSGNTERVRIDSSGNVGIGTSSPAVKLHVSHTDGATNTRLAGASYAVRVQSIAATGASVEATDQSESTYQPLLVGGSQVQFTIAGGENMRLDSSGRLGIGTTSPGAKLDVFGPASVTSFTGTSRLGVTVRGSTGATDYSGIDFIGNSQSNPVARVAVLSTASGSSLQFGTSNSYASGITNTALTIDFNGNVGIGTASPGATLEVTAPTTNGVVRLGALQFKNSSGNYSAGADGINIFPFSDGVLYHDNYDGGFSWRTGTSATERMRVNDTGLGIGTTPSVALHVSGPSVPVFIDSTNSNTYKLGFRDSTTTRGYIGASSAAEFTVASAAASERLRVDTAGNLLVNTTSAGGKITVVAGTNYNGIRAYASSGGYVGVYGEHSLNGGTGYVAYFYNTGAGNGQYIANGGSWLAISDERQKEDVKDLDATERLMQLRPVDYLWKHQAASEEPDRRNLGFIAQEVQQVFPELVSTSPDGMLGVEYTGLIAPLVKALQEATQKIEALEARVAALEA
jgi:hypothetical protein